MRKGMPGKELRCGILFILFLLLAGNAGCETGPVYAGWTVGDSWNGYGTILRSIDSGKSWDRQGSGQIADVGLASVFAVDPYTAWVVGDPDSGYGTIYHTTDGGRTWDRKGSSNPVAADFVPDIRLLKVHAVGNDVWVVGVGTILHTGDGGVTWANQTPSPPADPDRYKDANLQGVFALDSKTVWVTGGPDSTNHAVILKTINSGQSWTSQSGGDVMALTQYPHILGVSAADADTAWAVGSEYSLLKTIDGGTTWTRHPDFGGLGDINEVDAVNSSTVWVATDNEIVWTTDGGSTWSHSQDHGLSGAIAFMGISAVSDQKSWGSFAFSDGYIVNTMDGGNTWTKIDQLDEGGLPSLWTISFATQPISDFQWSLFVPAISRGNK